MPSLVTEMWSVRDYQRGKSARRAWQISGVASMEEARLAVGAQAFPGAEFPLDARLIIKQMPRVAPDGGPTLYRLEADYVFAGSGQYALDVDPLDLPPKFFWAKGIIGEPMDVDADGHVVLNSAGLPFSNPPSDEIPYRILTVTRNESRYDIAKSLTYEGQVNSDSVQVPMTPGPVAPGQMLCVTYEPTDGYDRTSLYVPVAYTFWLRKGNKLEADGTWDAWKLRLRDQGLTGWYDKSGTKTQGPFCHADGSRVVEPVLLDGTGKPVDSTIKVLTDPAKSSSAAPVSAPTSSPALPLIETVSSVRFLKFRRSVPVPFAGLSLF